MSEPEVWTAKEVLDKADWEGSLLSLYHWGGPDRWKTGDEEVDGLWQAFCDAALTLDALSTSITDALESLEREQPEDDEDDL